MKKLILIWCCLSLFLSGAVYAFASARCELRNSKPASYRCCEIKIEIINKAYWVPLGLDCKTAGWIAYKNIKNIEGKESKTCSDDAFVITELFGISLRGLDTEYRSHGGECKFDLDTQPN